MDARNSAADDAALDPHLATDATVVFDGGAPDGGDGLFANTRYSWVAAATRLTLDAAIRFDGITWWGGYGFSGTPDADDQFRLDIFELDGGRHGRLIHGIALGSGCRTATGRTIGSLQLPEYRYSAEFADTGLEAGSYWISLSNNYCGIGNWFWETTSGGPQLHGGAAYNLEKACWDVADHDCRSYDLAFRLTHSKELGEASRLTLVGLVLAGLASAQRRWSLSWPRLW